MNKEELQSKAREYAVSVLDAKINEIAEAYIKGYEDGVKSVPVEKTVIDVDGVKYYDFGLPSGLLWSEPLKDGGKLLDLPYVEASKYRLPTKEEVDELFSVCLVDTKRILGRNGVEMKWNLYRFWLKNELGTNPKKFMAFIPGGFENNQFEGCSNHLVVVKPKDEIK